MKWIYKKEIIPAVFFILIISIVALLYVENETNLYKRKGVITSALVTGFDYDYKGRLDLKFEFFSNNSKIEGSTPFPELKRGSEKYMIGHYFPVMYIKDDQKKNQLLASEKMFKKLSLQIPDSLSWLIKFEKSW